MEYNIDKINYEVKQITFRKDFPDSSFIFIKKKRLTRDDNVIFNCVKCGKRVEINAERFVRNKKENKLCWNCNLTASRLNNPNCKRSEETKEKLRKRVREDGRYIDEFVELVCKTCGKTFKHRLAHSYTTSARKTTKNKNKKNRERKFCSEDCRRKAFAIVGSHQGHHGCEGMANLDKTKQTKPEELFENKLKDVKHTYQKKINKFMFDFYLEDKTLIEVDGDYWHYNPEKQKKIIKLIQFEKIIKDAKKTNYCIKNNRKLIRVWESEILDNITLDEILKKPINQKREFSFDQIILKKEFLLKLNKSQLEQSVDLILQWIRLFYPNFYINYNEESLDLIVNKISKDRLDFWDNPNTSLSEGNLFLKNRFMSFWKGIKSKDISLFDAFYSDKVLEKIIRYRVGLNNKRETFDISMKNIIRGFISGGYSISWFSPSLAYEIYKRFAGNAKRIYDPCSGFGARALGWKAFGGSYYFGVDVNPETVDENKKLLKEIGLNGDVICGLSEKVILNEKFDFALTCPPYFNNEDYSKKMIKYEDIEKEFLVPMIKNTLQVSPKFSLVVDKNLKEMIERNFTVSEIITLANSKHHFRTKKVDEYIVVLTA